MLLITNFGFVTKKFSPGKKDSFGFEFDFRFIGHNGNNRWRGDHERHHLGSHFWRWCLKP